MIKKCQEAERNGFSLEEIRFQILPELIEPLLASASDFLLWVKESREYSCFYYDVQESGVCAKPVEAAALILEAIAGFEPD